MKKLMHIVIPGIVLFLAASIAPAQKKHLWPAPVEQELAAKADYVTELTLDKNMLSASADLLERKDKAADLQRLVKGLESIYLRDYQFEKDGAYTQSDIDKLRKHYTTPAWIPALEHQELPQGGTLDVALDADKEKVSGIFMVLRRPRHVSFVYIVGAISLVDIESMKEMAKMKALGGSGDASDDDETAAPKGTDPKDKDKE